MIDFNEASLTTLTEIAKKNPEDPKIKAKRDKENIEYVKKCKGKIDRREYGKLTANIAGFPN